MLLGNSAPKINNLVLPGDRTSVKLQFNPVFKDKISMTGRLHRDFVLDRQGCVRFRVEYNLVILNPTLEEIITINGLDGKQVTFYPHSNGGGRYTAWLSVFNENMQNKYFIEQLTIKITTTEYIKPLKVVSMNPECGSAGMRVDDDIYITFNYDIDESTINSSSVILSHINSSLQYEEVAYTFSVSGNVLTINPDLSLEEIEEYSIFLSSSIKGLNDSNLRSDFNCSFATKQRARFTKSFIISEHEDNVNIIEDLSKSDVLIENPVSGILFCTDIWILNNPEDLIVTEVVPVNASINIPLNQEIIIRFNKELNPDYVNGNNIFIINDFTREEVSGVLTLIEENKSVNFTPDVFLDSGKKYWCYVLTEIEDIFGTNLKTAYQFYFTTAIATNMELILAWTAGKQGYWVPNGVNFVWNDFSIISSIDLLNFINHRTDRLEWIDRIWPDDGPDDGIITNLMSDCGHNAWFTNDDAPLIVMSSFPYNGQINVPVSQIMHVIFNKMFDYSTITTSSIIIRKVEDGSVVACTYISDFNTVQISHIIDLEYGKFYTLTVYTTVKESILNRYLYTQYQITFKTENELMKLIWISDTLGQKSNAINVLNNGRVSHLVGGYPDINAIDCGDGQWTNLINREFYVVGTYPEIDAVIIGNTVNILITFNHQIISTFVNTSYFKVYDMSLSNPELLVTFTVDFKSVLITLPVLLNESIHSVWISKDIQGVLGVSLGSDFSFNFRILRYSQGGIENKFIFLPNTSALRAINSNLVLFNNIPYGMVPLNFLVDCSGGTWSNCIITSIPDPLIKRNGYFVEMVFPSYLKTYYTYSETGTPVNPTNLDTEYTGLIPLGYGNYKAISYRFGLVSNIISFSLLISTPYIYRSGDFIYMEANGLPIYYIYAQYPGTVSGGTVDKTWHTLYTDPIPYYPGEWKAASYDGEIKSAETTYSEYDMENSILHYTGSMQVVVLMNPQGQEYETLYTNLWDVDGSSILCNSNYKSTVVIDTLWPDYYLTKNNKLENRSALYIGTHQLVGGINYGEIPTGATINLSAFSFTCWIKTGINLGSYIAWQKPHIMGYKSNIENDGSFGITLNKGFVGLWQELTGGTYGASDSTVKVNDGLWHQICLTFNGSSMKLYSDKILVCTIPASGLPKNTAWFFGALNYNGTVSYPLSCNMCWIHLFKKELSQSDINDLFYSEEYSIIINDFAHQYVFADYTDSVGSLDLVYTGTSLVNNTLVFNSSTDVAILGNGLLLNTGPYGTTFSLTYTHSSVAEDSALLSFSGYPYMCITSDNKLAMKGFSGAKVIMYSDLRNGFKYHIMIRRYEGVQHTWFQVWVNFEYRNYAGTSIQADNGGQYFEYYEAFGSTLSGVPSILGSIEDVKMWNRKLNLIEIDAICNNAIMTNIYDDFIHHYELNDLTDSVTGLETWLLVNTGCSISAGRAVFNNSSNKIMFNRAVGYPFYDVDTEDEGIQENSTISFCITFDGSSFLNTIIMTFPIYMTFGVNALGRLEVIYNGQHFVSDENIEIGIRYHITFIIKGCFMNPLESEAIAHVFLNGVKEISSSEIGKYDVRAFYGFGRIASEPPSFTGILENIKIFNRALTDKEAFALSQNDNP